ncbi:hypothetical protein yfred0001_26240 [Yersinia frederiksenii ATCC 33641]|nr:hypothetical protein yfred0001_26240 [Yersinia frederiksenii ATCC 33641]
MKLQRCWLLPADLSPESLTSISPSGFIRLLPSRHSNDFG